MSWGKFCSLISKMLCFSFFVASVLFTCNQGDGWMAKCPLEISEIRVFYH